MRFADHRKLKLKGRNFDCSKCHESVQKIRRCREDRIDFTPKDGSVFPIFLDDEYSMGFGFCPGKATWDARAMKLFETMQACLISKTLWAAGGIGDQPAWFVDIFKEFAPLYESLKLKAQWGSSSEDTKKQSGSANNRAVGRQKK